MNDKEIDEIFERGAGQEVDAALLNRISESMGASLRPVRPLAPAVTLALWLLSIAIVCAAAYAGWIGYYGVRRLSVAAVVSIFTALGIFTWFAALASVAAMTPGGGLRWKNPAVTEPLMTNPALLLISVCVVWLGIDAALFPDYDPGRFIPQGMSCLRAGLLAAIPTGGGAWMVLRRGYAVNPGSAGLAAGTLAGLAGLTMLELHCPNFRAPHIMVWHTAVVPVSALAGALLARIIP